MISETDGSKSYVWIYRVLIPLRFRDGMDFEMTKVASVQLMEV